MEKRSNVIKSKNQGSITFAILGSMFFLVGCAILFFVVYPSLKEAKEKESWNPVSARVVSAELEISTSKNSTSYKASGVYVYKIKDTEYTGDRIYITDSFDNIGDFQKKTFEELESAKENKSFITIYVDPTNPNRAIFKRNLRKDLTYFLYAFAMVFGSIGLAFLIFYFFVNNRVKYNLVLGPSDTKIIWLQRPEWTDRHIQGKKVNTFFFWYATIAAFLILAPGNYLIWESYKGGNKNYLLLGVINIILIILFIKSTEKSLLKSRFKNLHLELDPHPGSLGGDVGGHVDLPIQHDSSQIFHVTLSCIEKKQIETSNKLNVEAKVLWQDGLSLLAVPTGVNNTRLRFSFQIPSNLPESSIDLDFKNNKINCVWELKIEADIPGIDLAQSFQIPVFETGHQHSSTEKKINLSSSNTELISIHHKLGYKEATGEIFFIFAMGREMKKGFAGIAGGLAFGSPSIALAFSPDLFASLFLLIFFLIGLWAILYGVWQLGNRRIVRFNNLGVSIKYWLFGFPVKTYDFSKNEITGIGFFTKGINNHQENKIEYKILLKTMHGQFYDISDRFFGKTQTARAAEYAAKQTGLPFLGELEDLKQRLK